MLSTPEYYLHCGAKTLNLSERTHIMGILNITPDSFSDGGHYFDFDAAVQRGIEMIREGADLIDIGGESSRPGADPVSTDEEMRRVIPVIERLSKQTDTPLSIDTTKARVAEAALEAGASIVNDISGLQNDPEMVRVTAEKGAPIILMHMRGTPGTMQNDTEYKDVIREVADFLDHAILEAVQGGIPKNSILVDPGIGFGKSVRDNFRIIRNLPEFGKLECPILMGVSRKSFIGKTIQKETDQRLAGSLAAVTACILNGAHIIRVHDVAASVDAARIADEIKRAA